MFRSGDRGRILPGLRAREIKVVMAMAVISLAMGFIVPVAGCGEGREEARWKVAVDILPYADLVYQVASGQVQVEVLVPPGASPHTYDLTPRQRAFVEEADLVVANGLGLEPWLDELIGKGARGRVILLGERLPPDVLLRVDREGHGHVADERVGPVDPHVWLDPQLMALMAEEVAGVLAEMDPGNADFFWDNARAFRERIELLDEEIRKELSRLARRDFVAYHSAWAYFARRYGLVQAGVVEERPGEEPGAGELARLVEEMRDAGTNVVFTEPQLSSQVAEVLAREVGPGVRVVELDPLGRDDDPDRSDYIGLMRFNLRRMVEALGGRS